MRLQRERENMLKELNMIVKESISNIYVQRCRSID